MAETIESLVDLLLEEGESEKKLKRSNRPTKEVRTHLLKLDELYTNLSALNQQAQEISSAIKSISAEVKTVENVLMPLLEEYEDKTARIARLMAKIEEKPAKKSAVPSWKKFVEWALDKLGSISSDLRREGEKVLEASKRTIPAERYVKFTKQESMSKFSEGITKSIASALKGLVNAFRSADRQLSDIESKMDKLETEGY